jgi:hypothetical protein
MLDLVSAPGVPVRVYDAEGGELGLARVPPPVIPGDLLWLDHGRPLQVVAVAPLPPGSSFDTLVEATPAEV